MRPVADFFVGSTDLNADERDQVCVYFMQDV